jgi:hypothetical protein
MNRETDFARHTDVEQQMGMKETRGMAPQGLRSKRKSAIAAGEGT